MEAEKEITKLKCDLELWKYADKVNMKAMEKAINTIITLVEDEYSDAPCRVFNIEGDADCVDHGAFGSNNKSHCFMCIFGHLIREAAEEVNKENETQSRNADRS